MFDFRPPVKFDNCLYGSNVKIMPFMPRYFNQRKIKRAYIPQKWLLHLLKAASDADKPTVMNICGLSYRMWVRFAFMTKKNNVIAFCLFFRLPESSPAKCDDDDSKAINPCFPRLGLPPPPFVLRPSLLLLLPSVCPLRKCCPPPPPPPRPCLCLLCSRRCPHRKWEEQTKLTSPAKKGTPTPREERAPLSLLPSARGASLSLFLSRSMQLSNLPVPSRNESRI